jgi:hypothetical protein
LFIVYTNKTFNTFNTLKPLITPHLELQKALCVVVPHIDCAIEGVVHTVGVGTIKRKAVTLGTLPCRFRLKSPHTNVRKMIEGSAGLLSAF